MNKIIPYYHPTTVGFIDDNARFIDSLAAKAPDTITTKVFYTPEEALEWANSLRPKPPLAHNCFTIEDDIVRFDATALEQEIKQPERFERLSVFVVDYAMPTMNGVDFCAELQDRDIRCLLLTGLADERIAVAAFNRSLIHRYVTKAMLDNLSDVYIHVRDLEEQYFAEYGQRLSVSLATTHEDFAWMHEIDDFLTDLKQRLSAVEYYLVDKPRGYLLLDRDGNSTRMIVLSDDEIAAEIDYCMSLGAPVNFRTDAAKNHQLPYLMEDPRDYLGEDEFPWHETLHRFEQVGGWNIAVVSNPPADIDFDPKISSYTAFKDHRR